MMTNHCPEKDACQYRACEGIAVGGEDIPAYARFACRCGSISDEDRAWATSVIDTAGKISQDDVLR
jgi:hypothetical protein